MKAENLKTIAYAAPTAFVTKLAKDLKAAGYQVVKDRETMVAKLDDQVVARALKMRSTWCVRANPEVVSPVN